jgi:hypothetical protein
MVGGHEVTYTTTAHPGKRRLANWFAWGLCALVAIATVYTIGDILINYAAEEGLIRTLVYILAAFLPLVCAVLAALIVLRQPRNAIGWLLFVPAWAGLVDVIGSLTVQKLAEPPPDPSLLFRLALWLDSINWLLFVFPLLLILVLFPTGRPPSRRWNWVVALALGMAAFNVLLTTFAQYWESPSITETQEWRILNPIGFIPNEVVDGVLDVPWLLALTFLTASSMAALVWRYRRSSFVVRTQIKWPLFASAVFAVVYVAHVAAQSSDPLVVSDLALDWVALVLELALLAVPLAIGLAILRYRLWDIDLIIRRTLVYGALTVLLALLFFGGITALQALFGVALGRSQVGTVGTTLAVAVLALPLRNRIQTVIDQRFYRRKYDAQRVVSAFATQLQSRGETDARALAADVMDVIQQTLQPSSVKVWLVENQFQREGATMQGRKGISYDSYDS